MDALQSIDLQSLLTVGIVALSLYPLLLFIAHVIASIHDELATQQYRNIDQFVEEIKELMATEPEAIDSELIPLSSPSSSVQEQVLVTTESPTIVEFLTTTETLTTVETSTTTEDSTSVESKKIPNLESKKIRDLRDYIRDHNLQELVREHIGKSVSRCTKPELIKALNS